MKTGLTLCTLRPTAEITSLFVQGANMSLKGVRQMKELVIRYSDYDGSSKGIREWMRTNLVKFAETNPELMIKTELKRCVHPFLRGNYANGNTKTICIKNLQPENITSYVNDLRNQIGRKVSRQVTLVFRTTPQHSILLFYPVYSCHVSVMLSIINMCNIIT